MNTPTNNNAQATYGYSIAQLREDYILRNLLSEQDRSSFTEFQQIIMAIDNPDQSSSSVSSSFQDPMQLFSRWLNEAIQRKIYEPNAMTLATCTKDGHPSARMVLLKGLDEKRAGFKFFTNYDSRKGSELSENPKAALVFWWGSLGRQVRVEGTVVKLPTAESDEYFNSRPLASRLAAMASHQSEVLSGHGGRTQLEQRFRDLVAQYASSSSSGTGAPKADNNEPQQQQQQQQQQQPQRPSNWGGYMVLATAIEFWQGQENRLHYRLRYTRRSYDAGEQQQQQQQQQEHDIDDKNAGWHLESLSP